MDENKQINYIAMSICDDKKHCEAVWGQNIDCVHHPCCETAMTVKKLYNAGYRKQSDTAREILQMIKDKGLFRYGGYLLHDSDFDTIGKLYGVEVEE